MPVPNDRTYLETHEWHRDDGGEVVVGITQIAADELTDITFVSLPRVGARLEADGRFGEIESVKATSDLYSGVGGEVVAVNEALNGDPGLINRDPHGAGWLLRLKPSGRRSGKLLSAEQYLARTGH